MLDARQTDDCGIAEPDAGPRTTRQEETRRIFEV